jgi:hypothetical protein
MKYGKKRFANFISFMNIATCKIMIKELNFHADSSHTLIMWEFSYYKILPKYTNSPEAVIFFVM